MKLRAAMLLAALAGCGAPSDPENPPGYEAWQTRNFILGQGFSGGATLDGLVMIHAGAHRGDKGDWIELAVNGTTVARTVEGRNQPMEATEVLVIRYPVRFRAGPNWIRFFSSAARQGWEFQVDTRFGTRFAFTPKDKSAWEMIQTKDE